MIAALVGALGIVIHVTALAIVARLLIIERRPYYKIVGVLFVLYIGLAFIAPPPPFEALLRGVAFGPTSGVRTFVLGLLVAAVAASYVAILTNQRRAVDLARGKDVPNR